LDWLKNKVAQFSYDEIDRFAEKNMAQDMELMFFPYFTGAGTPLCNENARGTFTGLELRHTAKDLALAVMEGVVFHTALIIEEYERNGAKIGDLRIMGGAVKSKPWIQILQSVLDCKVIKVNQTDAGAMGAAIIAAVGCGMRINYQEAAESMVSYEMTEESPEASKLFYHKKFEKYKKQWEHIKEMYKEEGETNDKSMVS
jgi:sugar (pentulose or hexulose) kinase